MLSSLGFCRPIVYAGAALLSPGACTSARLAIRPAFAKFSMHDTTRSPRDRAVLNGCRQLRMLGTGRTADGDSIVSSVEKKLVAALAPKEITVIPTYGDPNGSHVSIDVVSDAFEGLNTVKRHKLVYKAIWEELQGPIHAVDALTTRTSAEAEKL